MLIPNGRRVKQYLPKGVMNVVKILLSSCSGICQKPEAASRDVKIVEPANLASVSSVVGSWYVSLLMFSFSFWSPTQILTAPADLACTV